MPAPGRTIVRPGVIVSALIALAAGACDVLPGGAPVLELDSGTVQLTRGAQVHDVDLAARSGRGVEPARLRARRGDVVRFRAADPLTYAVVFIESELAPDARAFLERTGQLRGPPLVSEGASWIVSFEDAPAGRYPFLEMSHGARGEVVIGS